ncbi:hypothetical protein CO112_02200 [Candidatus Dojkabacteria bacterium CG_4_9_14_3_um_filter_150_Dojkabacteria_WS6_41_13]|uniref:Uncharacterized protein n=1 Tax=Candidatus Dojkabacteria bacterium CG_4_10_14_0_2_um_filter_Dojkabacteria_WS6_41_15 TaxID=2014249 RepID=A0A2M7W0W0_9BACT|nr:MAG: hypothetical protein COZ14_04930 [Candidatus Dojkabacteria bacterium CG_4_10_14_3_um_filter_Dojkabacteria_WS6_41_9]PJA12555.1 MAG: hypothetical protein COX64_04460 [Candidatus Dojkabacteria bacterium CG_4_10_14_0_2_um_filter_Dojkabacteria_WS6_41_15]PJB22839.1 MAG: hypothetical protein CO112_02200 [Candidatus Dojkabacteria bacterium CG_4_9_14_3_um_filter_150_Dojkabacteria_WS6_41_13]
MPLDKKQKRAKGNISLTTVILVGALLIVSGMAVLSNAIDIAMSTKSYFNRTMTDIRTSTCIEEGMRKLVKLSSYTGTVSVTYPDGSCQVVIADVVGDPTHKTMAITTTYNEYTLLRNKKVNITTNPMSVSN